MSGPPDPARLPHRLRERAPRRRLVAPVAFRRVSEDVWSRGATVDISRSGILFVPAKATAPDAGDLLMVVFLSQVPHADDTAAAADLYCGGRVARRTETASGEPALAVQIEFEWAEKPPHLGWDRLYD